MGNWRTLPHELKCRILDYHIDQILRVKIHEYLEHLSTIVLQYSRSYPNGPLPHIEYLLNRLDDLQDFLDIAPELRQDVIRIIAKKLPVLCDRYSELQKHDPLWSYYGNTIYNAYYRAHSEINTMKEILLEVVKDELGRWKRCPSGRLRRIDL